MEAINDWKTYYGNKIQFQRERNEQEKTTEKNWFQWMAPAAFFMRFQNGSSTTKHAPRLSIPFRVFYPSSFLYELSAK